jgi:hypothetical protein
LTIGGKGVINMPKGIYKRKPRTPEHNATIAKAHTDVSLSPEHCKAISKAKKGVPLSPEHCDAISKAKLRIPNSPEHCDAISKAKTGVPQSLEHRAALSAVRKGVPKTPEHIAAIKRGQEESGMYERQRGGYDLVIHHYIYDHSDLSLNTVQMTRSSHTSLHMLLKKLGYKVPYINVEESA